MITNTFTSPMTFEVKRLVWDVIPCSRSPSCWLIYMLVEIMIVYDFEKSLRCRRKRRIFFVPIHVRGVEVSCTELLRCFCRDCFLALIVMRQILQDLWVSRIWSRVGSANRIGLDCLLATEQDNLTISVSISAGWMTTISFLTAFRPK